MTDSLFRMATWDIECTSLDATYGRILCVCFKFLDEDKVRTVTAPRYKDEPKLLKTVMKWWDDCDVAIDWNGKLFDVPFVNARLLLRRNDMKKILPKATVPLLDPKKKHIDGRWINAKLRTRGNRLDGAAKDFDVKHQKYDVRGEEWIKAADGDKAALAKIVKHCELDVKITEDVIKILKPLIIRVTT